MPGHPPSETGQPGTIPNPGTQSDTAGEPNVPAEPGKRSTDARPLGTSGVNGQEDPATREAEKTKPETPDGQNKAKSPPFRQRSFEAETKPEPSQRRLSEQPGIPLSQRPLDGEQGRERVPVAPAPSADDTTPNDRISGMPDPQGRPVRSDEEDTEDIVLATRSGQGGQLVTIQLSPPGLGPLTVVLSFFDNDVRARFAVEDEETLQRVKRMTPLLRRSLGELWDVKDVVVMQRPAAAEEGIARSIPTQKRPPFDQQM